MKLSPLPAEEQYQNNIKPGEMVGRTCLECHYRCAGRDPTARHVLGPCHPVGAVGSDCFSFLSFFPVHHGRVGCGSLDPPENANLARAPTFDPHHLGCLEAVGSGVGRVSAFPNHCHFATDDFLWNEPPCFGCCPSLYSGPPPDPLFANPKREKPAEVHRRGCPSSPDPVTRCGAMLSNPGRNPSTPGPCHRLGSRLHDRIATSAGHYPLVQQHHGYLYHSDSDRPRCASENGLVSQHGMKDRLCSWCR